MDVESKTKKIMRKAIMYYAELNQKNITKTQIKIFCDEELNSRYGILHDFMVEKYEEVTLKDLILSGDKIDFMGETIILPPIVNTKVKKIIKTLGIEHNKPANDISLIIASADESCDKLVIMMALKDKPFKTLEFEKILN